MMLTLYTLDFCGRQDTFNKRRWFNPWHWRPEDTIHWKELHYEMLTEALWFMVWDADVLWEKAREGSGSGGDVMHDATFNLVDGIFKGGQMLGEISRPW
jgi:hypothetical protein